MKIEPGMGPRELTLRLGNNLHYPRQVQVPLFNICSHIVCITLIPPRPPQRTNPVFLRFSYPCLRLWVRRSRRSKKFSAGWLLIQGFELYVLIKHNSLTIFFLQIYKYTNIRNHKNSYIQIYKKLIYSWLSQAFEPSLVTSILWRFEMDSHVMIVRV